MQNELTPGPWQWLVHDQSMATLHGPDEMADHVLSVSPCNSCVERRKGEGWTWGACMTPKSADARLLAASRQLYDAAKSLVGGVEESAMTPGVTAIKAVLAQIDG